MLVDMLMLMFVWTFHRASYAYSEVIGEHSCPPVSSLPLGFVIFKLPHYPGSWAQLILSPSVLHTVDSKPEDGMHDLTCLIKGCQAKVYAPAGTHSICREHFLNYLTWRRRRGPQMFMKYAGMTMEERDPLVAEWANTIRVEEAPTASAPKT